MKYWILLIVFITINSFINTFQVKYFIKNTCNHELKTTLLGDKYMCFKMSKEGDIILEQFNKWRKENDNSAR